MSDYNCIDVIREAQATVVAAAQSSTSFIPPLGREKARVFTLNLRNRLIFKAADEEGALESADFIGKQDDQKIVGLLRRQDVAKLLRAGRAQDKAAFAAQSAKAHLRRGSLRERPPQEAATAAGAGRPRFAVVSPLAF